MDKNIDMEVALDIEKGLNNLIVYLGKQRLKNRDYIKKYFKARKIQSDIVNSMTLYINEEKYNLNEKFNKIIPIISKQTNNLELEFDGSKNLSDINILNELFIYNNINQIESITDVYIKNKKYRNMDKIKMLYAMRDSYVGLFKIIKVDRENGYVTYEDVFTKKRFKVIDIAMSSTEAYKINPVYLYNRIINYDGIRYGTGIHCAISENNKEIKNFIKKHRYSNCSDFARCLMLYDISKRDKSRFMEYTNFNR